MSILVNKHTRVVVQGITGKEAEWERVRRRRKREREKERGVAERVAINSVHIPKTQTWKAPTCMGTQELDPSKHGSFTKAVRANA